VRKSHQLYRLSHVKNAEGPIPARPRASRPQCEKCCVLSLFLFLFATDSFAETVTWVEDFKNNKLSDGWRFRDLRSHSSAWMIEAWERTVTEEGEDHWGALH